MSAEGPVRAALHPKDGSVLIFLATSVVDMDQMSNGIGLGVWAAIGPFQRLAS